MKQIIILNGFPQSGKDTFCEILKEISDYPVISYSMTSRIKEIAPIFGWDGVKDPRGRKLLSELIDATNLYNEFCWKSVIGYQENICEYNRDYIYIIHSRRPKDIRDFVNYYNSLYYDVCTVFIERKVCINKEESNSADQEVMDYKYDYIIENNLENKYWREGYKSNIERWYYANIL